MMWFAKRDDGAVLWIIPTHDPVSPILTKKVDGGSWGPPDGSQVWEVSDTMFSWLNGLRVDEG